MPTSRAPTLSRSLALVVTALTALATALSLSTLPDGPADAAAPGDDVVLTTGTIRTPTGHPVTSGTVQALALVWVPGRGEVGHRLGTSDVGPDGGFEVTAPQSRLNRWRDDDGGLQVELVVDTPQGGMIWTSPSPTWLRPPARTRPRGCSAPTRRWPVST